MGAGFGFSTGLDAAGGLSGVVFFAGDESLSVGAAALSESAAAAALSEVASGGASLGLAVSDGAGVDGAGVAGAGVAAELLSGGLLEAAVVGCGGAAVLGCVEGCESGGLLRDGGGVVVSGAVEFWAAEGFFDGFSHARP